MLSFFLGKFSFRYAQTGNTGVLPNDQLPHTFAAQAFDSGDPCQGGSQCCLNNKDGQGGWACESGEAPCECTDRTVL